MVDISPASDDKYEDGPRLPSATGVYHFDCNKYCDNQAKLDLLNCMIKRHQEEINRLQNSKMALEKLKSLN